VHLLFIMLRVMRLSVDNPLMWQSALTGDCTATAITVGGSLQCCRWCMLRQRLHCVGHVLPVAV
jgi:hypothetical protein